MPPTFPEALKSAEERLTHALSMPVRVVLHRHLSPELSEAIATIDRAMFRTELRYTIEEISESATKEDYIAITAETDAVIAVSYGYAGEDGYFLDTLATTVERKGIGSTLATLLILYAAERGYPQITLYTEKTDEKGRRLREWYKRALGFTYKSTIPRKGDVMVLDLTPEAVEGLYARHVATTSS